MCHLLVILEKAACFIQLHLHKKFEILSPNQDEVLNKRSKLVSKCSHVNKCLSSNFKANDWHSI